MTSDGSRAGHSGVPVALIIAVFFLSMLPLAATRVIDTMNFERYYSDAALSMLHTGDYLTARQGDGTVRLHKPMLTYWLLVLGYKILGVSFFSSRLPFLLVGCATIALTYKLSLELRLDNRAASTAALILASNLLFICIAARAIQDVLLAFALLLSAYGFIRLICLNQADATAHWAAYGGAALGVAVKGLLPVVFVAYALAFAWFTMPRQRLLHRLLNIPVVTISVLVAGLPAALLAWKHGAPAVWQSFWSDQIAGKTSPAGSFLRIGGYLLVYLVCFAPWFVAFGFLTRQRSHAVSLTNEQRKACAFIVIWSVLLAFIFGLGDRVHNRYLVPAVPLLALVFALMFDRFPNDDVAKALRPLLNLALFLFLVLALFGVAVLAQNHLFTVHLAGPIIVGLTGLMFALRIYRRQLTSPAVLSFSILLLLLLCLAILTPFTLPDQTSQITRALDGLQVSRDVPVLVGNDKLCSRLRLSANDRYNVQRRKSSEPVAPPNTISLLTEGEAKRFRTGSINLEPIATYPSRLSARPLVAAVLHGDSKSYIDSRTVHCYLTRAK